MDRRGAPRRPARPWNGLARGAAATLALVVAAAPDGEAIAQPVNVPAIVSADYAEPTTRYPHGALGDTAEWGALVLKVRRCPLCAGIWYDDYILRLPETRVFEDTEPRLADLDGDGSAEVIVVESDAALGARLAVYDETGLVAATAFIGQVNRWLAPLGAADLDGDGRIEIAYVDRPHLARVLRVVEFGPGGLREEASAGGHTNHRFGDPAIAGGIADCGQGPEMLTADPDWTRIQGTRLVAGRLVTRDLGPYRGALACR